MGEKVTEYQVVTGAGRSVAEACAVLKGEVARMLCNGWQLHGGVAMVQNGRDYVDVAQALGREVFVVAARERREHKAE